MTKLTQVLHTPTIITLFLCIFDEKKKKRERRRVEKSGEKILSRDHTVGDSSASPAKWHKVQHCYESEMWIQHSSTLLQHANIKIHFCCCFFKITGMVELPPNNSKLHQYNRKYEGLQQLDSMIPQLMYGQSFRGKINKQPNKKTYQSIHLFVCIYVTAVNQMLLEILPALPMQR